jgi:ATP-dependent exoDNAse (exonuclease V) alpha subunit
VASFRFFSERFPAILILCIARDSEPRDIRGIGFKTADAIAMELGIDKTAMIRARAGISYALSEAMDEGHCGLPASELVSLAEKLLEVPEDLISSALGLELADGTVMADWVGETLVPAYAATIHKSQGSEYPVVVIPIVTQHYPMLQRNLLYTGVTRGKRPVVLVGQRKAIAIAVRGVSGRRRWSKLREWLGGRTQQVFGPNRQ